jgi:hypothetical protein
MVRTAQYLLLLVLQVLLCCKCAHWRQRCSNALAELLTWLRKLSGCHGFLQARKRSTSNNIGLSLMYVGIKAGGRLRMHMAARGGWLC